MASAVDVVDLAKNGDEEGVRAWISAHQLSEGFAKNIGKALIAAVRRGHIGIVEALLRDGQTSADVRDEDSWVSSAIKVYR